MRVAALYLCLGAYHDASASGLISVFHTLDAVDIGSCGEVGRLDILHESVGIDIRIVDIGAAAVNHLSQVVGGYIGGHTHSDTVAAVDEQVGYFCRHDGRLCERVVEVVHHVDRIFLQVVHDVLAHLVEPALGVTHGGGRVAVDRAEVTLSVDKGVAHVPVLRHSYQCTVYGAVAVGMVLTEHLTHHTGALLIGFVTGIADTFHTIEYTAVNRFESVAHIREGTGHDDRHGVVDIRLFHFLLDVDLDDSILVECLIIVHLYELVFTCLQTGHNCRRGHLFSF